MYACLFLIILGIVSVQGAQSENQQEKSMNLNAKRFYEPVPCARLDGGFCAPRPTNPNVWPCENFICPDHPCPEPKHTVCCCRGNDVIYD